MALRGTVVALLLAAAVLFNEAAASAGPPAAAPPDLETLQRLSEGAEPVRVRRVVITKKTTEATTPMTTQEPTTPTTEPTTEASKIESTTAGVKEASETSDFADPDFSGEKKEAEKKIDETATTENTTPSTTGTTEVTTEATKEPTTEESTTTTTTEAPTTPKTAKRKRTKATTGITEATTEATTTTEAASTSEATTEATTVTTTEQNRDDTIVATMKVGRRRVIIRKQPRTTTEAATTTEVPTTTQGLKQIPQDDDHLSPVEEMRLLKKLAKQGIAFGVRNKELEIIHNQNGELDLPPFAFSEDDNSITEVPNEEETVVSVADTIPPTTTTTTTEAPATTTENNENTEKELKKFEKEPFKVGTNIVPVHLFFNQNRSMKKRKRVRVSTTVTPSTEANVEESGASESTTASSISTEATSAPVESTVTVTVVSSSSIAPTSTPRTDDFLVSIPEKMLEAEEEKRLESFSFPVAPVVERTTMKPVPKSKMPEKMILPSLLEMPKLSALSSFGSLAVPVHPTGVSQKIRRPHRVDSDAAAPPATAVKNRTAGKMRGQRKRRVMRKKTALGVVSHPVDRETTNRKGPVRVRFIGQAENLVAQHQKTHSKIIRSEDPAAAEQAFAESLKKPTSTIDLVVASLRKMKRTNRMILNRARAAGEKTVQATATASHDGQVRATRLAAPGEVRPAVIDRDFTRKTVDRDA